MTVIDYYNYFRHQWINHPLLPDDDKGFELISVEEALGDFRSNIKEKGYAMRLIEPSYNIVTAEAHEARKVYQGGLLLVKYHSIRSGGTLAYLQARGDCETIIDQIIEKMVTDSREGHPLFNYSLDTPDALHVDPEISRGDGYSGCLLTFNIAPYFKVCPSDTAWVDGGQTPHTL